MIALALAASIGLYEQSMARLLEARFRDAGLSWMVMEAESGAVFASRWTDAETPVAPGSLVKAFTAMGADANTMYVCAPGRCWLPRGHGRLDVIGAIAQSCNEWFRQYVEAQGEGEAGPAIGLGSGWRMTPAALLRGFREVAIQPGAALVRAGMADSARSGTGRLAAADCLVKTGTAPCAHPRKAPGDGFVVCLFPAEAPRYVLLVRVHGTTGSQAAKTAGGMVRAFGRVP